MNSLKVFFQEALELVFSRIPWLVKIVLDQLDCHAQRL
jgi:hypothetical protein